MQALLDRKSLSNKGTEKELLVTLDPLGKHETRKPRVCDPF